MLQLQQQAADRARNTKHPVRAAHSTEQHQPRPHHAAGHALVVGHPQPARDEPRRGSVPSSTAGLQAAERAALCPRGQENENIPDYPRALFYPLRPWGAPVSAFPKERLRGQKMMLAWEIFTVAFIAYTAIYVPYAMTFGIPEPSAKGPKMMVYTTSSGWNQAFDIFSDLVFAADIFVQMHAAFFVENMEGDGQWGLVDKTAEIRQAYFLQMRPWHRSLLWDLLCAFPFVQVAAAFSHAMMTGQTRHANTMY